MSLMTKFGGKGLCTLTGLTGAIFMAGCSGTNSTSPTAHVRGLNAATTVDTTKSLDPARIMVNGAAAFGDLKFTDSPSPYLFIGTGSVSTASYANIVVATSLPLFPAAVSPSTAAVLPIITTFPPVTDQFYTVILAGRPDLVAVSPAPPPAAPAPSPPNALQSFVIPDAHPAVAAGTAALRVLNAAPDAGPVDVNLTGPSPLLGINGVPYISDSLGASSSQFHTLTAGTYTFKVIATSTGATLIPDTSITFPSGGAFTLIVSEPTNLGGVINYQLKMYQD